MTSLKDRLAAMRAASTSDLVEEITTSSGTDTQTAEPTSGIKNPKLAAFLAARASKTATPPAPPAPVESATQVVEQPKTVPTTQSVGMGKLQAALARAKQAASLQPAKPEHAANEVSEGEWIPKTILDNGIGLNYDQQLAVDYAMEGKSFVLTGAAGTGKTTAQAGVVLGLDKADRFGTHTFKHIGEQPGIAIVAFTKVAVRNIQKAIRKIDSIAHFADHCMTIHALLEYEPCMDIRPDPETGIMREVRVFKPMRNADNPLTITHLVLEEASMCGLDLWANLWAAMPEDVQIIQLGDINQLQPVFGNPILAYALNKLPVIELTKVYRQALDNPIIANAHKVLVGEPFESSECGRVSLITGKAKHKVGQGHTLLGISYALEQLYKAGEYDPHTDIILSPWNKRELGTQSINAAIGTMLTIDKELTVHQIIGGLNEVWLAVGDRVMVDKAFGYITKITPNYKYVGKVTAPPGSYTRTGVPIIGGVVSNQSQAEELDFEADYSDFKFDGVTTGDNGEIEDNESISARAASHIVDITLDDGTEITLSSGGDFAYEKFQLGYCLTVHKSQGSEWRKVFLVAHYDHASMLSREFVYTALTRAQEYFVCFGKEDLIERACARAEIKGNDLQSKIAYFSAKALDMDQVPITKTEGDTIKYAHFLSKAVV